VANLDFSVLRTPRTLQAEENSRLSNLLQAVNSSVKYFMLTQ
jgi:hypothetical protein